eukprot:14411752-Heterocapsa_arctica.AAC.1
MSSFSPSLSGFYLDFLLLPESAHIALPMSSLYSFSGFSSSICTVYSLNEGSRRRWRGLEHVEVVAVVVVLRE